MRDMAQMLVTSPGRETINVRLMASKMIAIKMTISNFSMGVEQQQPISARKSLVTFCQGIGVAGFGTTRGRAHDFVL